MLGMQQLCRSAKNGGGQGGRAMHVPTGGVSHKSVKSGDTRGGFDSSQDRRPVMQSMIDGPEKRSVETLFQQTDQAAKKGHQKLRSSR